jgi:hypothetical protein
VTGSIGFAKQKPDAQRTNLGKGKAAAKKFPAKKPGVSGDTPKPRKALAPKKGK